MSDVKAVMDENGNVEVTCGCGKPITHSNEHGMFCDDNCGLEESKQALKDINDILGMDIFKVLFDD